MGHRREPGSTLGRSTTFYGVQPEAFVDCPKGAGGSPAFFYISVLQYIPFRDILPNGGYTVDQTLSYIIGLGGVLSALLAWLPLANFIRGQKKDAESMAIAEGERRQILYELRKDIDSSWSKIRELEERMLKTQESMLEIKGDIKYLVMAMKELKETTYRGCSDTR